MKTVWSIVPIVGNLPVLATDPPALVRMLQTTEYDMEGILNNMSLTDTRKVHGSTLKHKLALGKDTSIKAYAEVVEAFQGVQEQV